MTTIASFRKSISELELVEQLQVIALLRSERRMIPERKVKAKKSAAGVRKPKGKAVVAYLDGLGKDEKQLMLDNLIKLRRKR